MTLLQLSAIIVAYLLVGGILASFIYSEDKEKEVDIESLAASVVAFWPIYGLIFATVAAYFFFFNFFPKVVAGLHKKKASESKGEK